VVVQQEVLRMLRLLRASPIGAARERDAGNRSAERVPNPDGRPPSAL
jgi:hypothetical protein